MNDWRTRSYLQIAALELLLGGPSAAQDIEVRRRRDIWLAIDKFCWPQYKEQQFGQLEAFTRAEAELLGYVSQSPPMKDLVVPRAPDAKPPEGAPAAPPSSAPHVLPEPAPGFPDWRSRSLFQLSEMAKLLAPPDAPKDAPEDGEVRRRRGLWLAVERFAWPQMKEQQFSQVESITRGENDLLRYLLQVPAAKELLLASARPPPPPPAPGAAKGGADLVEVDRTALTKKIEKPRKEKAATAPRPPADDEPLPGEASVVVDVPPDVDPLGDIAPVEKYKGPPAAWCYSEGSKAWGEFAEHEYKDKKKARAAAAMLKDLFGFLDKNPDSEKQLKGLEEVVGLSCMEVLNGALERRLR